MRLQMVIAFLLSSQLLPCNGRRRMKRQYDCDGGPCGVNGSKCQYDNYICVKNTCCKHKQPTTVSAPQGFPYSGSGYPNVGGYSGGYPGMTGSSGFSGMGGRNGFSGMGGANGFTGNGISNGFSGMGGANGFAGSGISNGFTGMGGSNGFTGMGGSNGFTGMGSSNGFSGMGSSNGFSGIGGSNGFSGMSGYSGGYPSVGSGYQFPGTGYSGLSGYSGYPNRGNNGYGSLGSLGSGLGSLTSPLSTNMYQGIDFGAMQSLGLGSLLGSLGSMKRKKRQTLLKEKKVTCPDKSIPSGACSSNLDCDQRTKACTNGVCCPKTEKWQVHCGGFPAAATCRKGRCGGGYNCFEGYCCSCPGGAAPLGPCIDHQCPIKNSKCQYGPNVCCPDIIPHPQNTTITPDNPRKKPEKKILPDKYNIDLSGTVDYMTEDKLGALKFRITGTVEQEYPESQKSIDYDYFNNHY